MTKISVNDLIDDEYNPRPRRAKAQGKPPRKHTWRHHAQQLDEMLEHGTRSGLGTDAVFRPTFTASKHEREWILDYLSRFYEDRLISDVVSRVKGGKEANVYCCAANPDSGLDYIAAKLYRPRMFRQLRNDARYRQGRLVLDTMGKEVRDDRLKRAIAKRTNIGQAALHTSWLEHEYLALSTLHAAGADVPQPIAHSENTILMEYLGEPEEPAPALHHVRLARAEARPLFERLLHNVELMLAHGLVHADLSAFNVLYWEGAITLIDFPQAVDVGRNPDAPDLLERDIARVCSYFARFGVERDPARLARDLWRKHVTHGSAAEQAAARAREDAVAAEEG